MARPASPGLPPPLLRCRSCLRTRCRHSATTPPRSLTASPACPSIAPQLRRRQGTCSVLVPLRISLHRPTLPQRRRTHRPPSLRARRLRRRYPRPSLRPQSRARGHRLHCRRRPRRPCRRRRLRRLHRGRRPTATTRSSSSMGFGASTAAPSTTSRTLPWCQSSRRAWARSATSTRERCTTAVSACGARARPPACLARFTTLSSTAAWCRSTSLRRRRRRRRLHRRHRRRRLRFRLRRRPLRRGGRWTLCRSLTLAPPRCYRLRRGATLRSRSLTGRSASPVRGLSRRRHLRRRCAASKAPCTMRSSTGACHHRPTRRRRRLRCRRLRRRRRLRHRRRAPQIPLRRRRQGTLPPGRPGLPRRRRHLRRLTAQRLCRLRTGPSYSSTARAAPRPRRRDRLRADLHRRQRRLRRRRREEANGTPASRSLGPGLARPAKWRRPRRSRRREAGGGVTGTGFGERLTTVLRL